VKRETLGFKLTVSKSIALIKTPQFGQKWPPSQNTAIQAAADGSNRK